MLVAIVVTGRLLTTGSEQSRESDRGGWFCKPSGELRLVPGNGVVSGCADVRGVRCATRMVCA